MTARRGITKELQLSEQEYSQIDPTMLDLFRSELVQHAGALHEGLVTAVEAGDPASLEPMMRAAHSIRGAARIVGIPPVADLAGEMERLLVAAQEGTRMPAACVSELLGASRTLLELAQRPVETLVSALSENEKKIQSLTTCLQQPPAEEVAAAPGVPSGKISVTGSPPSATTQPDEPVKLEDLSLTDIFRMDLQEHARMLDQGLVAVESEASSANLENLMRAAHSIKGSARIIGIDVMGALAHVMEDIFLAVQRGAASLTPSMVDALLQANDLFMSAAERPGDQLAASVQAEEGRYRDYSFSNNGREVYDWQTGNYLDVKPRGDDRFEVYDWQEHKYYDVKIRDR